MSPINIASQTPEYSKIDAKVRKTPIDDLFKKRRTCMKQEKSTKESEKVSEDDHLSYEKSSEESEQVSDDEDLSDSDEKNVLTEPKDDEDDPSYKESSEDEENKTVSEEESSEEESETNSEDDEEFSYGKRKKQAAWKNKNSKIQKMNKNSRTQNNKNSRTRKKEATTGLSAYEKMIEEKRAETRAFLESLKINEAKADFANSVNAMKKKPKPAKRQIKKVCPSIRTRFSKRIAKMNNSLSLSEDSLFEAQVKNVESEKMKSIIPSKLTFDEALNSVYEQKHQSYVEDIKMELKYSTEKHLLYDRSVLQNLTLVDEHFVKMVPERISGMSWYPSAEHLILAAGSKFGNIGIFNLESKSLPCIFKIHNEGITCLQYNPFNPVHLLSSSYDGILRKGDMIKQEFNEIYNVSNEAGCTYFDFLSPTTYLVALNNGDVTILDQRRGLKLTDKRHTCHLRSIKSVNIHPVNKNYFVTAENKGSICLWDLRKLQKEPVVHINDHTRCVSSAFFSPATGNSLLTTSFDDSIRIYDSTNLASKIKLTKRIRHNNNTGRWLSIFRASWLPHSDDLFVVGNLDYQPRTIQVFDKNMNICHLLKSPDLTTITSINVFHPFKPALAAGNSSGKVFFFL